ncbi:MAG TPA: hypothetical protein VKT78_02930 [Fimbriimonadaceae bacterium]|nr:hypothetical protein [Fimbriimonadaceae bacterium]
MSIGSIYGSSDASLALSMLREVATQNSNGTTTAANTAPAIATPQGQTVASNSAPLAPGAVTLPVANATVIAFTSGGVTSLTSNDPAVSNLVTSDPAVSNLITKDPAVSNLVTNDPAVAVLNTSDPAKSGPVADPVFHPTPAPTLTTNDPAVSNLVTNDPAVAVLNASDPAKSGPVADPVFLKAPGSPNGVTSAGPTTSAGSTHRAHHGHRGRGFAHSNGQTSSVTADPVSSQLSAWLQAAGVTAASKLSTSA